jgi:hypothetical protein
MGPVNRMLTRLQHVHGVPVEHQAAPFRSSVRTTPSGASALVGILTLVMGIALLAAPRRSKAAVP